MSQRLLEDVTVVDFSHAIAGPYGTVLLADYGADVVCIEPPGGGSQRRMLGGVVLPNVGRNKRSICVDLKADGATTVVDRLVERADIVFHNFSPGTMERLGYDYESVRDLNDDVIYCSISGFGETGPYKDRPGYDPITQATSGMMSTTGEPDRKPSRVGASVIDYGAGVHAVFAAMMALWRRDRTGEGGKIEVSLFDVASTFMGYWYTYASRFDRTPQRLGHTWELNAGIGLFETKDDPIYLATASEGQWRRLCEALDKPEWLEDPRFVSLEARNEHREELHEAFEATFAEYTRAELIDLFLEAHVPASEYKTVPEAAQDEHLRARDSVTSMEDVDGREVLVGGRPFRFAESSQPEFAAPPVPGADTVEVLAEYGFTSDEIGELIERGVLHVDQ